MDRVPRIWLTNLRIERFANQEELAKHADISRNYLSEIESGIKNPSVEVAKRIANALGCDWTLFFNYERRKMQQYHSA